MRAARHLNVHFIAKSVLVAALSTEEQAAWVRPAPRLAQNIPKSKEKMQLSFAVQHATR
jgi:hypothetical protein